MEVIIKRGWSDKRATLGMLTIKGVEHDPFFTLENPDRGANTDSRIPAGFYTCIPYSGLKFQDVYEVIDVPGRNGILFHNGNFEYDTTGCILVGLGLDMMGSDPMVIHSKEGLKKFCQLIGKQPFDLTIT